MILQPISDNVVLKIKDREREEVRQSGLIVMNQGTEQNLRMEIGEVVAVGEGRTLNNGTVLPLSIKAGQQVIYNKYAGTQIMSGEDKFLIVKETDNKIIEVISTGKQGIPGKSAYTIAVENGFEGTEEEQIKQMIKDYRGE